MTWPFHRFSRGALDRLAERADSERGGEFSELVESAASFGRTHVADRRFGGRVRTNAKRPLETGRGRERGRQRGRGRARVQPTPLGPERHSINISVAPQFACRATPAEAGWRPTLPRRRHPTSFSHWPLPEPRPAVSMMRSAFVKQKRW